MGRSRGGRRRRAAGTLGATLRAGALTRPGPLGAQPAAGVAAGGAVVNHDPERAEIVTRDVHNFWRAYDAAQRAPDSAARVTAYRDFYIGAGSPGLADWTRSRLADASAVQQALAPRGWPEARFARAWDAPATDTAHVALLAAAGPLVAQSGAEQVAAAVARRPRFYAAIRRGTLALDSLGGAVAQIRGRYRRLAALYPEAVFPPVYFLVGRLTSGGTTGPSGMLLGPEMRGADAGTPRDELTPWERGVVGDASGVPHLVAHELAHVEQQAARAPAGRGREPDAAGRGEKTLLAQVLDEGCADLLADVMAGTEGTAGEAAGGAARAYGLAHERAPDKQKAVREILVMAAPDVGRAPPGGTHGDVAGYAHLALAVASRGDVDALVARPHAAGVPVESGPRLTGDGYYEAVVRDPDGQPRRGHGSAGRGARNVCNRDRAVTAVGPRRFGGGAGPGAVSDQTLPADGLRLTRGEKRDRVALLRAERWSATAGPRHTRYRVVGGPRRSVATLVCHTGPAPSPGRPPRPPPRSRPPP